METLDGSSWDVVIAGTGLQPALLALSLSRSGKKILHLDSNDYYGGREAALSLSEATQWVEQVNGAGLSSSFHDASIKEITPDTDGATKLSAPRAYSISLSPTVLYTRSALLPALVSSKAHEQLEFLAVGSWFVYQHNAPDSSAAPFQPASKLLRVPNSREDIFSDSSLSLRAKGALVKFLRFVAGYKDEEKRELWIPYEHKPFVDFLKEYFKIQPEFHGPLLALCMSSRPSGEVRTGFALDSVYRHLTSMGVFGGGFSAVLPKYGGVSEVVQVACRAAAVGGTVYVLNRNIENIEAASIGTAESEQDHSGLELSLQEGDKVTTKALFGTNDQLPLNQSAQDQDSTMSSMLRSASIVGSNLSSLFPPSTEGSPPPSAAVVVFPSGSLRLERASDVNEHPVNILVHAGDSGECPAGQCVMYASTTSSSTAPALLGEAVKQVLASIGESPSPPILWSMQYEVCSSSSGPGLRKEEKKPGLYTFVEGGSEPVFDDAVLESVKEAWKVVTGGPDEDFLRLVDRNAPVEQEQEQDVNDGDNDVT